MVNCSLSVDSSSLLVGVWIGVIFLRSSYCYWCSRMFIICHMHIWISWHFPGFWWLLSKVPNLKEVVIEGTDITGIGVNANCNLKKIRIDFSWVVDQDPNPSSIGLLDPQNYRIWIQENVGQKLVSHFPCICLFLDYAVRYIRYITLFRIPPS